MRPQARVTCHRGITALTIHHQLMVSPLIEVNSLTNTNKKKSRKKSITGYHLYHLILTVKMKIIWTGKAQWVVSSKIYSRIKSE